MKCDICGKDYKNVGVHRRFAHPTASLDEKHGWIEDTLSPKMSIVVDDYTEKPLSELILEIRELIKCYQNQISIKTFEKNSKISEIEITARIQL